MEVQPRLVSGAECQVVVEDIRLERRAERALDLPAHLAREAILGEDDHDRDPPPQGIGAKGHPDIPTVVGRQDRSNLHPDRLGRGQEQLLLRHRVEDRDELLVIVRALPDTGIHENVLELPAQDRDFLRRLGIGLRGKEP